MLTAASADKGAEGKSSGSLPAGLTAGPLGTRPRRWPNTTDSWTRQSATLTATSADDGRGGWGVRGAGRAEDAAEGVDGLTLEAESYVGVDADVGVAEEFLDDDEIDALFQEQGGGRVPEIMEADRPEVCAVEEAPKAAGQVGGVERPALRGSEDEPVVRPACSGCLALFLLPFLVDLEGVDAFGGEDDAALGGQGLGVQDGQTLAAGPLEGAVDAGGAVVEVEVFPAEAEEFAFAEAGTEGEIVQRVEPIGAGRVEELTGLYCGERTEAPGLVRGGPVRSTSDLERDLPGSSLRRTDQVRSATGKGRSSFSTRELGRTPQSGRPRSGPARPGATAATFEPSCARGRSRPLEVALGTRPGVLRGWVKWSRAALLHPMLDARWSRTAWPQHRTRQGCYAVPVKISIEGAPMTSRSDDPFGQLAEEADRFDLPVGGMERILPPFEAGLVMTAGRALAVLAYRDAVAFGDKPFTRDGPASVGTVLALLPDACDRLDGRFRAGVARALWDLADDLSKGLAPLPRCAAETWALRLMLEAAPALVAASDEELLALGVAVPEHPDESGYRPPYWEEAWQLVVDGAKYSIPEAQPAVGLGKDAEDGDVPEEPAGGWDAPRYAFSPYSFIRPRDVERGHPDWAQRHLDGGALVAPEPLTSERATALLQLEGVPRPGGGALGGDEQDAAEGGRGYFGGDREGVLTPLGARLLAAAADQVAEAGWYDLLKYGDRVFERPKEEDDEPWFEDDSFLWTLPPLCDGQGAAWRLAMVGAVENLADDLRAGRAPSAGCTAEELALHLIVGQAKMLVDLLDDADYAEELGLPTRDRISVRHRAFDLVLEYFLQDFDVLMHYDSDLREVVTDPEHPANLQLGIGDLRPRAWFAPFGNTKPRPPRVWEPWLLGQLAAADPAAFFASTPALTGGQDTVTAEVPADELPGGLREEFENFVGLAQQRFFTESPGSRWPLPWSGCSPCSSPPPHSLRRTSGRSTPGHPPSTPDGCWLITTSACAA